MRENSLPDVKSEEFEIRVAVPGDTVRASEIVTRTLNSYGIEPDPIDLDRELLTIGQTKSSDCIDLVATIAGQIVGVAVSHLDGPNTFLCGLYVDKAYQGRGVGKALLNTVIGNARIRGSKRVCLETREIFKEAVILYESTGWIRGPNTANTAGPERTYFLNL